MLRWSVGPVCGVDNCRSRHWRIIDGQHVCRNGHVREGDIEMAEDEGGGEQGRYMRVTGSMIADRRSQAASQPEEASPKEVTKSLHKALTYILKQQAEFLVKEKGAPSDIMHVSRALFGLWVDYITNRPTFEAHDDSSGIESNSEVSGSENDIKPTRFKDKTPLKTKIKTGRYKQIAPYKPPLRTNVNLQPRAWPLACIYLACCVVQYPIYISDLMRWLYNNEYPQMNSFNSLPKEFKKTLHLSQLHNHVIKFDNKFLDTSVYDQVNTMGSMFCKKHEYEIPNLSINPLLIKLIYMLYLPPEIYPAVLRLIKILQIDFDITRSDPTTNSSSDDRTLYALVVLMCKILYGFDNVIRHPKPHEPGAQIIDWELWQSMVYRTWVETDSFGYIDPTNVLYWNTERLERCLDWAEDLVYNDENEVVNNEKKSREGVTRFMRKTFPLKKRDPKPYNPHDSILFKAPPRKGKKRTLNNSQSFDNTQEDDGDDENEEDEELNSDEELKRNGVHRTELPKIGPIMERDLFSNSNSNLYRPDKEISSDSNSDFEEFVQTKTGIYRRGEEDMEIPVEDNRETQKISQPDDHILLEVNQLVQSTTTPYEIQLTKFADTDEEEGKEEKDNDEGWEDVNEENMPVSEDYADALQYPGDVEPSREAQVNEALNEYWNHKAQTMNNLYYSNIRKFKEHNHFSNPVIPRKSSIMDLKNTRYMGKLLRPGHRYKMYDPEGDDTELVKTLFDAAPSVIGTSPTVIEKLFKHLEKYIVKPKSQ
ncbi:uncharacterized protein SAPINGB_P002623 [Magnusiomyces paraingens]|uniref:RRN7-type domain-containing protein n=1 Tax=Magnusiomyces paraingens TaxID=2606893 RepID=A0A5E8BEV9_9ASCO|nr:uncharacterized protein SAPINGB_P002623 [Saprochaete ingens]VVT50145.1 unnamed protein product [Saprochaete ingens]